ncbi:MAG: sulfatase-like hydrolase/transferase [Armatimonadota bacterium]
MSRPNLLFIFTDQHRADCLGITGHPQVQTPHLDSIGDEGIVFENAYCTQPVCTPSRSTIMTGLYPHNTRCMCNQAPLRRDIQTIAELLPQGEWESGYFGKWHLGNEVIGQHGFEKNWVATEDHYRNAPLNYTEEDWRQRHSSYHYFLKEKGLEEDAEADDGYRWFSRGLACDLPKELGKPAFLAGEVSDFIRRNQDQPFVAYVNFLEPHSPFWGPFDYMYDPEDLEFDENFLVEQDETRPLRYRMLSEARKWLYEGDPEAYYRRTFGRYLGNVSVVDGAVGRILDTLRECDLEEDTIIIYTSDHGDQMGAHYLYGKGVQYEESVRIPLLMHIPMIDSPHDRVDAPVSQVDLVPTLMELLGQEVPEGLDGYSMVPFISDEGPLTEENVFIEWQTQTVFGPARDNEDSQWSREKREHIGRDVGRTIVSPEGWKLTLRERDENELYNLKEDPHELENLFGQSQYSDVVEELTARVESWKERTDDPSPEGIRERQRSVVEAAGLGD